MRAFSRPQINVSGEIVSGFSIFYQFCVYCSVCVRIYSNDIMSFFDEKENVKFVAPSEYCFEDVSEY